MTKYKKVILLFLALMLPVCIFLFLKIFGKNQFDVPALFTDVRPENLDECGVAVALPYHVPDSVLNSLSLSREKLTLIHFGMMELNEENNLQSVKDDQGRRLKFMLLPDSLVSLKRCVFFLNDPNDLVLVDSLGTIRGQYQSTHRDEIDRLRMELSILFDEY
jgi:hypothetical protein